MSDGVPLRDVLSIAPEDVHDALQAHADESGAGAALRDRVAALGEMVGADEINEALETDVIGLIALGWAKLETVRAASVKSRTTPDTTTMVTLGEHKILADCHPVLEFKFADLNLTELKFTLELEVFFKSVKLAIRDARLKSIAPGEASVTARLKYGKVKLKEQKTSSWDLPAKVEFEPGIELA
jgi:hypothetical protein